jgi:predicted nucleotidyltransferase
MYLSSDYEDMIEIFNKHEVKYIIVGAFAMSKIGYSRNTYDIDLWVEKTTENAIKIYKSLEEFGVPFEIYPDDFLKQNSVFQVGIEPNRIDILTDIDGVVFEDAYNNSNIVDFNGLPSRSLSVEDLIKNKSSTERTKDKLDLEQLKALVKSSISTENNHNQKTDTVLEYYDDCMKEKIKKDSEINSDIDLG